jgi:hypothetical protein
MKKDKIIYRNGFPTMSSIEKLKTEFEVKNYASLMGLNFRDAYNINHSLVWSRKSINDLIPVFLEFLKEKGVEVDRHFLYESPINGRIYLKKKT